MRRTAERPVRGAKIVRPEICAGSDEALVVERHATLQPLCVGHGAGHQKNMADVARLVLGAGPRPAYPLEPVVTFQRGDLRMRMQADVRTVFDTPDEIARHALGQTR